MFPDLEDLRVEWDEQQWCEEQEALDEMYQRDRPLWEQEQLRYYQEMVA